MGRVENVEVYKDTENLCKNNDRLKNSIKNSIEHQKLILESKDIVVHNKKRYESPAKIKVSKKRTLEAASVYHDTKIAVHNFASAANPGGGVRNGSNAQEECLCRCSGLYFCLNTQIMWDGFYKPHRQAHDPLHNDDIILTPNVTVFKTDTMYPKLMKESDWYDVDVITCAAPNLRARGGHKIKISDKELLKLHEKRLKRILDVAFLEGDETVILGAFGCGVFMNDPKIVAQAAKNVISEYLYSFRNIEFAIYCSPKDDQNYRIFHSIFGVNCRNMIK